MSYTFGPVPSRRLGLSLGVDIVPLKTCTLSCIYCQVGKTRRATLIRREYVPVADVLEELKGHLKSGTKPDWVTFSGSGEPTLNSGIGEIIQGIKGLTDIPVCVITNGTLLWDPQVRQNLFDADAVMPSLDSAIEHTFQNMCHPHPELSIKKIINGLEEFRKGYRGKIWLEIMFVKGINDSEEELDALHEAVRRIAPDAVQLNTVVRPPADVSAKPLSHERLKEIQHFFGNKSEIIATFSGDAKKTICAGINDVRNYLLRRPGRVNDISSALGIEKQETENILEKLNSSGEIILIDFSGDKYWKYKE